MNIERALHLLSSATRTEVEVTDSTYRFKTSSLLYFTLNKEDLETTIERHNSMRPDSTLSLSDDQSIELLVRDESPIPIRRFRQSKVEIDDTDNKVTYTCGTPSAPYILFYLDFMDDKPEFRHLRAQRYNHSSLRRLVETEETVSIFEYIRLSFFRMSTVRIQCESTTQKGKMSRMIDAFLFQMAFNTDIALVPIRDVDSLSRSGRITTMRRNAPDEIDPPRRIYSEDLIHHYLLAISTDNPVVEYLSHYHVLEHFYETVFNEELINSIQEQLTEPAFSYKRKKDIKKLVTSIKKQLRIKNDNIAFSEIEALKLTLTRFVDIHALVSSLNEYDQSLLSYYKENSVNFSSASQVDLQSTSLETVIKKLANRIYTTRNALVHSKDGDKSKYTPFVDDHELNKELPLLRFLSEQTIIANSKLIE